MNRIGLTHPSTLSGKYNAETFTLYNAFSEYADKHLNAAEITYKLPSTGALVGPFGILLHTPALGRAFLDFSSALNDLPHITPRTRCIIALVVAAYERAPYQFYAYGRLATTKNLLTENELASLRAGLFAETFGVVDRAVYGVARELCLESGPLSERVWAEAVACLGKEGAGGVVQLCAFQRYVVGVLRGFDAQVPAEGERVENQGAEAEAEAVAGPA